MKPFHALCLDFDKFQWYLPWSPSFRCCINTEPGSKTVLEVRLRMIVFVGGIRWAVGLTSLMDLALNTRREEIRKKVRTFETYKRLFKMYSIR